MLVNISAQVLSVNFIVNIIIANYLFYTGRFFAVQEIQLSLIYLFRNYDITTASGKTPNTLNTIAGYMSTTCDEAIVFTRKD